MTFHELVLVGHYHVSALARTQQTKVLVGPFVRVLDALEGAWGADERAQTDLNLAHVPALFAERDLREMIERVAVLARAAGGEDGPAYEGLFPYGLEVELLPEAQSYLAVAIALRERLISLPAALEVKAHAIADFDSAVAKLSAAVDALEVAELTATRLRELAEKARSEFLEAYERDALAVEQMFPGDSAQQDLYFDERNVEDDLLVNGVGEWPPVQKKGRGRPS